MAAYLTAEDAATRLLDRYGITAILTAGDVDAASDELDGLAPFSSGKYAGEQARQFPRSDTFTGDTAGVVPDRILDWVALRAFQLATDEEPATISESIGGVSVTYAGPKISQTEKRMAGLLDPYLRRVGARV